MVLEISSVQYTLFQIGLKLIGHHKVKNKQNTVTQLHVINTYHIDSDINKNSMIYTA